MKWISWFSLILLLTLVFSRLQQSGPKLNHPAPQIKASTLEDQPFSLEDHRGKVVVLEFWATWCPPCRASLPALDQVRTAYQDDPEVWIGTVNKERLSPKRLQAFLKKMKVKFPVILDPSGYISADYKIRALPTLVIIDPEGKVRHSQAGVPSNTVNGLIRHIKKLIESTRPRS